MPRSMGTLPWSTSQACTTSARRWASWRMSSPCRQVRHHELSISSTGKSFCMPMRLQGLGNLASQARLEEFRILLRFEFDAVRRPSLDALARQFPQLLARTAGPGRPFIPSRSLSGICPSADFEIQRRPVAMALARASRRLTVPGSARHDLVEIDHRQFLAPPNRGSDQREGRSDRLDEEVDDDSDDDAPRENCGSSREPEMGRLMSFPPPVLEQRDGQLDRQAGGIRTHLVAESQLIEENPVFRIQLVIGQLIGDVEGKFALVDRVTGVLGRVGRQRGESTRESRP